MTIQHTEERGCVCNACCEERAALNELRRERSIEILGDRYVLHPSRTSGAPVPCECCARVETINRAITGYMRNRNG